jgi:uncharacterized protein (AIM24 family)
MAPLLVSLEGDPVYLREDRLLAFEAGVGFETGRLAQPSGADETLVQLAGSGSVVFAVRERLQSVEVVPDHPVVVTTDRLVGWVGRILAQLPGPADGLGALHGTHRLSGRGFVLLDARP